MSVMKEVIRIVIMLILLIGVSVNKTLSNVIGVIVSVCSFRVAILSLQYKILKSDAFSDNDIVQEEIALYNKLGFNVYDKTNEICLKTITLSIIGVSLAHKVPYKLLTMVIERISEII